jgi:anti-sigma factor RsiW
MNMNDDSWKLNAFVDGELDLAGQLEIEQRMELDDALRQQVETLRALSVAVRGKADRHEAPAALRSRISAMKHAIRPQAPTTARRAQSALGPVATALAGWLSWRPLVTSMAAAGVLAVTLNVALLQSSKQERLMDEAVASHVRSTVGPHLVDVLSSDHHTVKPFLSSKLGFSPPVAELPLPGSVFVGGRVDYLDGRPVAALVYRQGDHVVNSFVWPESASDSKPEFATERGYRIAHWLQGGMHHCVISDVNREEFQRVVDAVRATAAS